jgi:serine/threonine-protein kinase
MGEVYLAEELELHRRVALKLLPAELTEDERFRERFLRESRLAASLNHPHVVPVYRAGETSGVLFIAMHHVEGTDLRSLLRDHPDGLDLWRAVTIVEQVADALDAAHARGLIHRDVKPANVLISPARRRDHCYLADFGLTRYAGSQSRLTQTGQFVGTVDYVAPEQVRGDREIDHRVDVYSLGCVLFECLTGSPPYQGPTDFAVMWAHVNSDRPDLTERNPSLPAELDDVVGRALAKEPDDRYGSAGDLAVATRDAVGGRSVATTAQPVARPRRMRTRRRLGRRAATWAAVGAALAAVIAAIVAAFVIVGDGNGPPAVIRGSFDEVQLGRQMTQGAWRKDRGKGPEGRTPDELRAPGQVVDFRSTLVGLAGSSAIVFWSMRRANSAELLGRDFRNQAGTELQPRAESDTSEGEMWVPLPPSVGRYSLEIRLTNEGRVLDRAETRPFAGRQTPVAAPKRSPPPSNAPPPPPPVLTVIG